jgi:hypothetical protein
MAEAKSKAEKKGDALNQLTILGRVSAPNFALLVDRHYYTIRDYMSQGRFCASLIIGERPWFTAEDIERFKEEGPAPLERQPKVDWPDRFDITALKEGMTGREFAAEVNNEFPYPGDEHA